MPSHDSPVLPMHRLLTTESLVKVLWSGIKVYPVLEEKALRKQR